MEEKIDLTDEWKKLFVELVKEVKEINRKLDDLTNNQNF